VFRNPRIVRRTRAGIELHLGADQRRLVGELIGELRELLETDDPGLRRLFPTAYPDDPERDAAYQILARSELVDRRQASLGLVPRLLDAEVLQPDEAEAWMNAVNQVRLVLGTRLDVGEDDEVYDPDAPDAMARAVYFFLGVLLEHFVEAL